MTDNEIEIRLTELSNDLWSGVYETNKCFGEAYRQVFNRLEAAGAKHVAEKVAGPFILPAEQVVGDFLCFSLRSRPLKITRENAMRILVVGLP